MTRPLASAFVLAATLASFPSVARAQGGHNVTLHINPRWKQCSIQLDPALTQAAWRQFTGEAGVVTYFRPLADAAPMGTGRFEVSLLQWQTGIDDEDAAWNDTFVHPDSTHWLFEGSGLAFPGLTARLGVAARTDVGIYFTKAIQANYGFYGAQLQQSVLHDPDKRWSGAVRVSFVNMYGPDDVGFSVYGADLVTSKTFDLFSKRIALSPYGAFGASLSRSHEKSAAVSLADESVWGAHGMLGVAARYSVVSLGVEYGVARVQSFSIRVGFGASR